MARHVHGSSRSSAKTLWKALVLTAVFMVAEAAGGLLSGSLALLADAGHMLTDTLALALAAIGCWLGARPADARRSYGYRRLEVLAGWINGVTLVAIAGWIVIEAIERMQAPVEIDAGLMLGVAALGLAVNVIVFRILHPGAHGNINVQGALLHVLGDILGSVAAIAAGIVILLTGWTPIDPILSCLVAGLIAWSAWRLVRRSTHILLEGTPEDFDLDALQTRVQNAVPAVEDIHHIHAWSLTSDEHLVTFHARTAENAPHSETLAAIKRCLAEEFEIHHSVVQLETTDCAESSDACPG